MMRNFLNLLILCIVTINSFLSFENEVAYNHDIKEKTELLTSFKIHIENKNECSLKYYKLKTNFRYVYLVECLLGAKSVELHFINISNIKENQINFFNKDNKEIKKDQLILKSPNNIKVYYKCCQLSQAYKCNFISVIVIFKYEVNGLKEFLINSFFDNINDYFNHIDLLNSNNINTSDNNQLPYVILNRKKIKKFYEFTINVEKNKPLHLYASSFLYNFIYIDKNLNNLLKEENYQYETYFYKFICYKNFDIFTGTSNLVKNEFYIYKLKIFCSDHDTNNLNNFDDVRVLEYANGLNGEIYGSINRSIVIPSFHIKTYKYNIYTSSDKFWLNIKTQNNVYKNITINDKNVVSEYNLITLNEDKSDSFYDDCIEKWKLIQAHKNVHKGQKEKKK